MGKKTHETKPENQPICDKEMEQSVLGSILVTPSVLDEIYDTLSRGTFIGRITLASFTP